MSDNQSASDLFYKEVEKILKDSERCGSTPTLDKLKDIALERNRQDNGDSEEAKQASESKYVEKMYSDSLANSPRIVNDCRPIEVSDDWVRSSVKKASEYEDSLSKIAGSILSKNKTSDGPMSYSNFAAAMHTQLLSYIGMDGLSEQEKIYIEAYVGCWVTNCSQMVYDNLLADPNAYSSLKSRFDDVPIINKNNPVPDPVPISTFASEYETTYNTFTGCDMVCTFEIPLGAGGTITKVVGELQTISYSIHNEKMPVRILGNMNAQCYLFNGRTIAGSLIFTVFDKHWAKDMMDTYLRTLKTNAHFMADELPPMNITISFANEYGKFARLSLFGVTFVNEGQTMSVQDMYMENTFQYYATDMDYMTSVTPNDHLDGFGGNVHLPNVEKPEEKTEMTDIPDEEKKDEEKKEKPEVKDTQESKSYDDYPSCMAPAFDDSDYEALDFKDMTEEEGMAAIDDIYKQKSDIVTKACEDDLISEDDRQIYQSWVDKSRKKQVAAAVQLFTKKEVRQHEWIIPDELPTSL